MEDKRANGIGESTLTIKWWGVLIVIITFLGWITLSVTAQETRITKIETQFTYISQSLSEVKQLTGEIRLDQLRRYREEANKAR